LEENYHFQQSSIKCGRNFWQFFDFFVEKSNRIFVADFTLQMGSFYFYHFWGNFFQKSRNMIFYRFLADFVPDNRKNISKNQKKAKICQFVR
jgi:hypothetical protein